MTSYMKFAFRLAAILCLVQFAVGRLELDKLLFENIRFDLTRNCYNLERNFDKEFSNARQKVWKEASKLREKALTQEAHKCLETAQNHADQALDFQSSELSKQVKEFRDSLNTDLNPSGNLRELFDFRNNFRNRMNACKKTTRLEIKTIQNDFSLAGKRCLL